MIYIIVMLILALVALYFLSPRQVRVHASRAKPFPWFRRPEEHYFSARSFVEPNGQPVAVSGKFIGIADGDSCARFGIRHGESFIAQPIDSDITQELAPGKIVVVDGKAAASPSGYRLRRIRSIESDGVHFEGDKHGDPHRTRPVEEVVAVVTHVL